MYFFSPFAGNEQDLSEVFTSALYSDEKGQLVDTEELQELDLDKDVDVNGLDERGFAPIHYAALLCDYRSPSLLLQRNDVKVEQRACQKSRNLRAKDLINIDRCPELFDLLTYAAHYKGPLVDNSFRDRGGETPYVIEARIQKRTRGRIEWVYGLFGIGESEAVIRRDFGRLAHLADQLELKVGKSLEIAFGCVRNPHYRSPSELSQQNQGQAMDQCSRHWARMWSVDSREIESDFWTAH